MATVGGCTWIIVFLLEQITFQHGKKALLPEDQMVQYLDAQNIACLHVELLAGTQWLG